MIITVLGDICPAWGFPKESREAGSVFHDLLPVIRQSDYCVANLESPATDHGTKLKKNSICLKAEPGDLSVLKEAGIDAVALANNHILDYERQGLEDTLKTAADAGLCVFGAGTAEEAAKPHIIEIKGKKIGFLAFAEREFNGCADYGIGANLWDDLESPGRIAAAKQLCDFLVVQYHGGIEHYIYPSPLLRRRCRKMADSGADFVTCQHSHCIGTREKRNGAEILYGQGNCIFGYRRDDLSWNRGLIARITIGDSAAVDYIPVEATESGERLCDPEAVAEVLRTLEEESAKIVDDAFIEESWRGFCNRQKDMYLPLLFARSRYFNKLNRILKGKLIDVFTSDTSRMNAMNLIRCDAHREVVQTVLEKDFFHGQ